MQDIENTENVILVEESADELLEFLKTQSTQGKRPQQTGFSTVTKYCPSLPRFTQAAINPRIWRDEEEQHIQGCRFCQKALAESKRNVWHPTWYSLLLWCLKKTPEEERLIQHHIEENNCLHCEKRIRKEGFQTALQIARVNADVLESFAKTMKSTTLLWETLPSLSPKAVGSFSSAPEVPYVFKITSEDHDVSITFLKNDYGMKNAKLGDLVALLSGLEEYEDRHYRIKIKNATIPETAVEKSVVLVRDDDRVMGRMNFGPWEQIVSQIGENLEVEADFVLESAPTTTGFYL